MSDNRPDTALVPPFTPTDDQRAVVARLVALGMPLHRVVMAVTDPGTGKPVTLATLKRAFEAEIRAGRVEVDEKMAGYLLEHAEKNFAALRHFEETRWGLKGEPGPDWHGGPREPPPAIQGPAATLPTALDLDFARRVAFLLEKAARHIRASTASS